MLKSDALPECPARYKRVSWGCRHTSWRYLECQGRASGGRRLIHRDTCMKCVYSLICVHTGCTLERNLTLHLDEHHHQHLLGAEAVGVLTLFTRASIRATSNTNFKWTEWLFGKTKKKKLVVTTARPSPRAHSWPCLNAPVASYFSSSLGTTSSSSWRHCFHFSCVICFQRSVQLNTIALFHLTGRFPLLAAFLVFLSTWLHLFVLNILQQASLSRARRFFLKQQHHYNSSPLNIASFCHFYANGTVSLVVNRSSVFSLCFPHFPDAVPVRLTIRSSTPSHHSASILSMRGDRATLLQQKKSKSAVVCVTPWVAVWAKSVTQHHNSVLASHHCRYYFSRGFSCSSSNCSKLEASLTILWEHCRLIDICGDRHCFPWIHTLSFPIWIRVILYALLIITTTTIAACTFLSTHLPYFWSSCCTLLRLLVSTSETLVQKEKHCRVSQVTGISEPYYYYSLGHSFFDHHHFTWHWHPSTFTVTMWILDCLTLAVSRLLVVNQIALLFRPLCLSL